MHDKFIAWQYRNDHNCWDFVREFLLEYSDIPDEVLPISETNADDKRGMTKDAYKVFESFEVSGPEQFAIASHYHGKVIYHVGVVYNGRVYHAGEGYGATNHTIKDFERLAQKTIYRRFKNG